MLLVSVLCAVKSIDAVERLGNVLCCDWGKLARWGKQNEPQCD
jgi:hypothetical protein